MSDARNVSFPVRDGTVLNGLLFECEDAVGTTVLHGATGVPFRYYENFASWYASQKQHHVLIYAYRDTENMSARALRKSTATMADWGVLDQPAALDYILATHPGLPAHTIGHSLGGFCVPFHENSHRITQHTTINSGPAYVWAHPWHFVWQALALWYFVGPLADRIAGYLPGRHIGLNADLPSSVYWQWRKWCTNERFHEVDWGKDVPMPDLNRFKGKLHVIATADDHVIPAKRVWEIIRYFPAAEIRKTLIDPKKLGCKSIGHIAPFSKRNKAAWPVFL